MLCKYNIFIVYSIILQIIFSLHWTQKAKVTLFIYVLILRLLPQITYSSFHSKCNDTLHAICQTKWCRLYTSKCTVAVRLGWLSALRLPDSLTSYVEITYVNKRQTQGQREDKEKSALTKEDADCCRQDHSDDHHQLPANGHRSHHGLRCKQQTAVGTIDSGVYSTDYIQYTILYM